MSKSLLRKTCLGLLLAAAVVAVAACATQETAAEPVSRSVLLLDTVCTVTLYEPADETLLEQALTLCAEYESLFSRTAEGSDIWRVNAAAGAPVEVDARTAALIQLGLDYGALSGGLFDISIGRLSSLWNFGEASAPPPAAAIAAALATVDYSKIRLEGNVVTMEDPAAMLDLGGIAKGYIADELAAFLRGHGVRSALIDLGGNIMTVGAKADGSPWYIGVELPFSDRHALVGVLAAGEGSVVTSGVYERQFMADGVLYHHVLDPRTGYPAKTDAAGVTVVTQSSAAGDALATILLLLGMTEGNALLAEQPGASGAAWVAEDGSVTISGSLDFQPAQ